MTEPQPQQPQPSLSKQDKIARSEEAKLLNDEQLTSIIESLGGNKGTTTPVMKRQQVYDQMMARLKQFREISDDRWEAEVHEFATEFASMPYQDDEERSQLNKLIKHWEKESEKAIKKIEKHNQKIIAQMKKLVNKPYPPSGGEKLVGGMKKIVPGF